MDDISWSLTNFSSHILLDYIFSAKFSPPFHTCSWSNDQRNLFFLVHRILNVYACGNWDKEIKNTKMFFVSKKKRWQSISFAFDKGTRKPMIKFLSGLLSACYASFPTRSEKKLYRLLPKHSFNSDDLIFHVFNCNFS